MVHVFTAEQVSNASALLSPLLTLGTFHER